MNRFAALALLLFSLCLPSSAVPDDSSIRMIRSLSGPSGKMVGTKYVIDEVRNRFVFPNDSSLVIYFEWKVPIDDYTLSAYWKDPQGRTAGISPDLKIKTTDEKLCAYWTFLLDANREGGIWTAEIRVNGAPAGSHSFEVVVPPSPKPAVVEQQPAEPTMDELYRSVGNSLVWIDKFDGFGNHVGRSTGFVIAADSVLTTFRSIDAASKIEVTFTNEVKAEINGIISHNRSQDWALIKVKTEGVPALTIGTPGSVVIGKQQIAFGIGAGRTRTIGAVDIVGKGNVQGIGERISFNPTLPSLALGGPLLDFYGKVIGVIGSNQSGLSSGNDLQEYEVNTIQAYGSSATPIDLVVLQPKTPLTTLKEMRDTGVIAVPLSRTPLFVSAVTSDKVIMGNMYIPKSEFTRKDTIMVVSNWRRYGNIIKGVVSLKIYDLKGRLLSQMDPQILDLPTATIQFMHKFKAIQFEPGIYMTEVLWENIPVWRTLIKIQENKK
jgi:hypothetical protein